MTDRVRFEVARTQDYPGDGCDLVAVFDCLHDMGDPVGAAAHSSGAGSGSRQAIGVGVLGGIIAATALAVFLVPLFYVWVRRLVLSRGKEVAAPELAPESSPHNGLQAVR